MREMPLLPPTVLSPVHYLCSLKHRPHDIKEQQHIKPGLLYYISTSLLCEILHGTYTHPISEPLFHLSSLTNRCCSAVEVKMMDGVVSRHILLLRVIWAESRLLTARVSHFLSSSSLLSSLTFRILPSLSPYLQHPTTHGPVHLSTCQPWSSNYHSPVICPCPALKKSVSKKVKFFFNKGQRGLSEDWGRERKGAATERSMTRNVSKQYFNIFIFVPHQFYRIT